MPVSVDVDVAERIVPVVRALFTRVAVLAAPEADATENVGAVIPAAAVIVCCELKICAKFFAVEPSIFPTDTPPEAETFDVGITLVERVAFTDTMSPLALPMTVFPSTDKSSETIKSAANFEPNVTYNPPVVRIDAFDPSAEAAKAEVTLNAVVVVLCVTETVFRVAALAI